MKESDFASALKRLKAPAPDPKARLEAKRAALAAFERAQTDEVNPVAPAESAGNLFQALWRRLRPSRENTHGSGSMKWFDNRGMLAGAAGVCVVALGLTMVWPNLTRDMDDVGREPAEVATQMQATDAAAEVGAGADPASTPALADTGPALVVEPAIATAEPRQPAPDDVGAGNLVAQDNAASTSVQHVAEAERAQSLAAAAAKARESDARHAQSQAFSIAPAAAPPPAPPPARYEEITATGVRRSLAASTQARRDAVGAVRGIPSDAVAPIPGQVEEGRDRFESFDINPVRRVADAPLSTFSADVDTASYSFVRAMLNNGRLPQKDAVRTEEMINYFDYAWPGPRSRREPFRPTVVVTDSPWNEGRKLVHVGIKGYELDGEKPDSNLVLLLDVSGSMTAPNKLPLAVRSMEMVLESLKPTDTVAIVVYAGAAGTVLEPTPVRERSKIVEALRSLRPGGSTAGAEGIQRAYDLAERNFRKGGVNRILLATDGDFNVGIDSTDELKGFVERKREKGIYLSVLGFGQGNYRDELAQALAQNGNGVAVYIDTENEARKVLVEEASSSLFTIARDVKFQVEFNPATVSEYRLVGYETRALRDEDFNNDAVDAGDIGAGHTVTAIYEITPVGAGGSVDEPRYDGNRGSRKETRDRGSRDEYGFVKIRYKLPDEDKSRLISEPIPVRDREPAADIARDVTFSTAVAGFAQLLRGGTYTGPLTYDDVMRAARDARGEDRFGYRAEFIDLVRKAQTARGM